MAKAKYATYSFYRPHARVQFKNELKDPFTGEITYPASMTKQEFLQEADINNIMKQYSVSGMLKHVSAKAAMGTYEDLPDSYDFQESLEIVKQSTEAFMTLPSRLRERFNNQPAEFLAFVSDPKNLEEMRDLGLAHRPLQSQTPSSPLPGGEGTEGEGGKPQGKKQA